MRYQLDVFRSEDTHRKAIVYWNEDKYEIDYAENGLIVTTESYEGKSLRYHEDAAENYVNGIKHL